ncbi:MAG: hypothetical protein D6806_08430 [Deltaproteobacteria bacterium]|nr:MAG: hypothetical protein D6806_08430 [Deltaproteobacteria bacterium]
MTSIPKNSLFFGKVSGGHSWPEYCLRGKEEVDVKPRKKGLRAKKLPEHLVLRCVMMGHQVSICRRLCVPVYGRGLCGRPALHHLRSRHQRAIEAAEKSR